jgi:hypothetical protein
MGKADKNGRKGTEVGDGKLDDLGLKILELELMHPGSSTRELIGLGGLNCDRKTVDLRRRSVVYQRSLVKVREDSIHLLTELEGLAIKTLHDLLESKNPGIRLRAAQTLATGTLELRREEIRRRLNAKSQTHQETIKVIFDYEDIFAENSGLRASNPVYKIDKNNNSK